MVHADHNVGVEASIKNLRRREDRNYFNLNQPNKGTVYFKIFHQNIRGLAMKTGELVSHRHPDYPKGLRLTEHKLKGLQLEKNHNENYKLGAHYFRQTHEKAGVANFVHNNLRVYKY
jgi:hypothetical protein